MCSIFALNVPQQSQLLRLFKKKKRLDRTDRNAIHKRMFTHPKWSQQQTARQEQADSSRFLSNQQFTGTNVSFSELYTKRQKKGSQS